MGRYDSTMHSREHNLGSQLETASGLIKPDHVDDASQNDSLLQSSFYIPNASNSNGYVDDASQNDSLLQSSFYIPNASNSNGYVDDASQNDSLLQSSFYIPNTSNSNGYVDEASQNDLLLQSSLYILNADNSNENSNASTGLQSDIIQRPDITSVSIPESHDLIASVSNISETSIRSEFNSSSHPLTNNVHSHTEPGIIAYL